MKNKMIKLFTCILSMIMLVGCENAKNAETSVSLMEDNKISTENIVENDVLAKYEKSLLELETLKSKNLEEAYKESLRLQAEYPDDIKVKALSEEIVNEYIESCIQKLADYNNNQDYLSVIELYDSEKELLVKSNSATEIYNTAIDDYSKYVITESDQIFYSEGAEAACANIVKYKGTVLDSGIIDSRIELYRLYEPVSMIDLDTFYFEGKDSCVYEWGLNDQDNLGNDGFEGYRYYIPDTGWQDEKKYKYWEWKYTYLLDGKYDHFDAILATSMESKDYIEDKYDAYVEVYNGDVLLFESEKTRGGIEPQDIHVNIENAQEITVVIKGRAYNCGSSKKFEVGLLNPTFSKTIPETLE